MNKFIGFLLALSVFYGCSDDDDCNRCPTPDNLVSPTFSATEVSSQSPVSGLLYVYPCNANTSTFFGNYRGEPPTVQSAFGSYLLKNGNIASGFGFPLLLPLGVYNMVYWVEGYTAEPAYPPAINDPQPEIGDDLTTQYLALRLYTPSDTVYVPVYDYIFAQKEVNVGDDDLEVPMRRVVSGLKVIVQKYNETALDDNIDSIQFFIGGVAEKLDLYTAEPVNLTKTVMLGLTMSTDRMSASNNTAMLFPTVPTPPVTVMLTLKNGQKRYFHTKLTNNTSANNKLTVTINIGAIFDSPSGNGFEVHNWTESQETINAGNIEPS